MHSLTQHTEYTHISTHADTQFTHTQVQTNVHAKHNQLSQNPLTGLTTELEKFYLRTFCLFVATVSFF